MPQFTPTEDFIIELFCKIDDEMKDVKKHSQSNLYPSEIVAFFHDCEGFQFQEVNAIPIFRPAILYHWGECYFQRGEIERAKTLWNEGQIVALTLLMLSRGKGSYRQFSH